jgi:hypothetical protein
MTVMTFAQEEQGPLLGLRLATICRGLLLVLLHFQ